MYFSAELTLNVLARENLYLDRCNCSKTKEAFQEPKDKDYELFENDIAESLPKSMTTILLQFPVLHSQIQVEFTLNRSGVVVGPH